MELLGNNESNEKQIPAIMLSKREIECLMLAALGYSLSETAEVLKISQKTVEQYRNDIKRKLKCRNITHAVFQGIKFGLITPIE